MKVKFNRITKELTFLDGTTTLNSNDVLWHTLEVEMEGGDLLPNEHLFVAFSKPDGSISTQGDLLPKKGAYHIPQEVLASAGEWTLQILIRVYDAVSGTYIQRGASNKGSFSVEEGLHFNGETNPVTINSLGSVKTDLSAAQEAISKLSEEVDATLADLTQSVEDVKASTPLVVNRACYIDAPFMEILDDFNRQYFGDYNEVVYQDQMLFSKAETDNSLFGDFNKYPEQDELFWVVFETNDGYKIKVLAKVYLIAEDVDEVLWQYAGEGISTADYKEGGEVFNDKLIIIRNGVTQRGVEDDIDNLESAIKENQKQVDELELNLAYTQEDIEDIRIDNSNTNNQISRLENEVIKSIQVSVSETDYKLTLTLIKENGEKVSSNTIDLPLESMVVDAKYYPEDGGAIVLTLQSGRIIAIPVANIVQGLISADEKGVANGVASLDVNGKVPKEQLPDDIGSGGGSSADLSDYVKKTQLATSSTAGLVKVSTSYGMKISNGFIMVQPATESQVSAKSSKYAALTPSVVDDIVKVGVTTNTNELSDTEKASACDWIGAMYKPAKDAGGYMIIPTINHLGEQGTIRVSYSPLQYTLVPYQGGGTIRTNAPTEPLHCANKEYVDERNPKYTYVILIPYAYGDYDNEYDWCGIMFQFHSNTSYTIDTVETLISALPDGKVFPVTQSIPGGYSPRDYVYSIRRVGDKLEVASNHFTQAIVFNEIKVEKIENY